MKIEAVCSFEALVPAYHIAIERFNMMYINHQQNTRQYLSLFDVILTVHRR